MNAWVRIGELQVGVEDEDQSYVPEVVEDLLSRCASIAMRIYTDLPDAPATTDGE